jgi:hypothetical protein
MYKTIGLGSKGPVLTLRINNTQEKVRNRTVYIGDSTLKTTKASVGNNS